jgi:hypothetical protein
VTLAVEQAEDERRDERHDDDDERRRANLFGGRPCDLLELAGHLVRELIEAVVAVEHDACCRGDDRGDQRDPRLGGSRTEVAPDPVDRPLQQIEQQHRTTQVDEVDWLVGRVLLGHEIFAFYFFC